MPELHDIDIGHPVAVLLQVHCNGHLGNANRVARMARAFPLDAVERLLLNSVRTSPRPRSNPSRCVRGVEPTTDRETANDGAGTLARPTRSLCGHIARPMSPTTCLAGRKVRVGPLAGSAPLVKTFRKSLEWLCRYWRRAHRQAHYKTGTGQTGPRRKSVEAPHPGLEIQLVQESSGVDRRRQARRTTRCGLKEVPPSLADRGGDGALRLRPNPSLAE